MNHILRLFARDALEYDYYDAVKHKCRVNTHPVYFNSSLARIWFATSPF